MKLDATTPVTALIGQDKQDRTASFPGGDGWAAKLTLGQIIKGKVLRSYGDGRYGVDFGGQQRIVDSGVPLSIGDQLRGRVVGLAERVTIERLPERGDASTPGDGRPQIATTLQDGDSVPDAAQRLQIRLGTRDADMIAGVAKKLSDSELAIRAGLFVAKLGLPVSADLVRALYERISPTARSAGTSPSQLAPILEVMREAGSAADANAVNTLAQCLADDCNPDGGEKGTQEAPADGPREPVAASIPGFASGANAGDAGAGGFSDADEDRRLSALLAGVLNVQTGASLQHRFRTLPVVIGGRLLEFDLALFDHAPRDNDGVHSRRLRFSLTTEHGPVDVDCSAIDSHVHIAFTSPRSRLLDALEEHAGELAEGLRQHGWMVEGTDYRCAEAASPARAIVDHVLAQDSLRMAL